MKFTIFSHSHCNDGLVAAAIMKYTLQLSHQLEPEVIFVSYGKEQEAISKANLDLETTIYCVDFAFNKEITLELLKKVYKVYVLDHHKTAFENLHDLQSHYNFYFTYDVEKSGASIVHNHCIDHLNLNGYIKINQQDVVSRIVSMVEDRDLWLFKLSSTKEFAEYLFAYVEPNDIDKMTKILFEYKRDQIKNLCQFGSTIMEYKNNLIKKKLDSYVPLYLHVDNKKLLIINETQPDLVSQLGNDLCKKYDVPVCLYRIYGSEYSTEVKVSLSFRSMDHLDPVDAIARLFSGGGHRNASAGSTKLENFVKILNGGSHI